MVTTTEFKKHISNKGRSIGKAKTGDEFLGPFSQLPGEWSNGDDLKGRGWNMIALPFVKSGSPLNYRVLVNQYNETLNFTTVDTGVPNRGIKAFPAQNKDQLIVTLDYKQVVTQMSAADFPESGRLPPTPVAGIHHEPGLFLHMRNFAANGLNIEHPYLAPYKHFKDNPFEGIFDVTNPSDLLRRATPSGVQKTTTLHFSTNSLTAGIVNIPFIVKHANASEMEFTMWVLETQNEVFIQYMQIVMLDFFERSDNIPGQIKWPHISFNTMKRRKTQ